MNRDKLTTKLNNVPKSVCAPEPHVLLVLGNSCTSNAILLKRISKNMSTFAQLTRVQFIMVSRVSCRESYGGGGA